MELPEIALAFTTNERAYRRKQTLIGAVGFGGFGALIAGIYLPGPNWIFEVVFIVLLVTTGVLTAVMKAFPRCPVCGKNAYHAPGVFCPVCGTDGGFMKPDLFHGSYRCSQNEHALRYGRGGSPRFPILYCTHCGSPLRNGEPQKSA